MDHREAGRYWDANAEAWTVLSRAGYDVYRDQLNTPAFLEMLPDVTGLSGLDVGCGEGHNTRLLADRGARMAAMDISQTFIHYAQEEEAREPRHIRYSVASAVDLPFADGAFDFVTGFMSFMDIPDTARVLAEARRVLRPGGFLQCSIEHPCFNVPRRRRLRGADGRAFAVEVGDYFRQLDGEMSEWIFNAAPPELRGRFRPFQIPRFSHTLSGWVNLVIDAGFVLEHLAEPRPSDETVRAHPRLQDAQIVAYFLHLRARKPVPAHTA
jgi:ubiquinone/menaquinone biosynthesis C-methylase UbiE